MTAKIPATVVTGFLGAGKTSLIRHLLEHAGGRRIALIVNEFGDLGVDGEILRGCGIAACADDDIVELANGCICCTVADDFLPTMAALLDRPNPPDHIVIETSGLALPKPLLQAFNWPAVRTRVTVDGVIAVLDGPAVRDGLFADDPEAVAAQRLADDNLDHDSPLHELYEDQVACADLLVLNKCDQLSDAERDALAAGLNGKRVLHASHGRIDPRVLLGLGAAAEDDVETRRSHHDGEDDHDHDEFASFVVDIGAIAAPADLVARLEAAAAALPILRVKGFLPVAGKEMRLLVQGVGKRFQHYYDRPWRDGEARLGRLVVIGTDALDEAAVRAALGGTAA
jgi:cobalamin biosynthesis protein CobW